VDRVEDGQTTSKNVTCVFQDKMCRVLRQKVTPGGTQANSDGNHKKSKGWSLQLPDLAQSCRTKVPPAPNLGVRRA